MPKPMRDDVVNDLKSRAYVFGDRFLQLQPMDMTHDECLHLVAPTYHHELLKTAATVASIAGPDASYLTIEIPYALDGVSRPTVDLTMRTHQGYEPPLRPRDPKWQPQCPLEIQKKVTDWTENYLRHSRMAATTQWVVEKLQEMCDTGHQIRSIWPAILHLTAKSENENTQRWVEKFGIRQTPRNLPQITPAFRRILNDCSEWCAQAVLLDEVKRMEYGQVVPSRDRCYSFTLELEGTEVVLTRAAY